MLETYLTDTFTYSLSFQQNCIDFKLSFFVFTISKVQTEYEARYGPCCGKKHGAVQDSPRPGWRDEISQLSQIREPSSIGRDADSTTTNGALPGTSGLQVPIEHVDDSGPWSPREHIGDSTASLNSSVSSSLALKVITHLHQLL